MKLIEILKILEKTAPVSLSDAFCRKYGLYDNSGIIVDCGKKICGALFSLDLSDKTIGQAKDRGYNLIVTHHPAIYGGVERLTVADPVAVCIKNGISVISMHLNFDVAPKGIDYYLMRGLGGTECKILSDIEGGGYGRVYSVQPALFEEYAKPVKKNFSARTQFYGDGTKLIKKVASFCGAGCDGKAIAFAAENGADAFASSDMKHHEITALLAQGINVIHLTHYSAENYGFNKIYDQVSTELQIPSAYFADSELL